MAELGLFPLPLVLVPAERVPLHIFEPRYRELIGECLERDGEFGIVLLKSSGDIHHVGTRATVSRVLEVLPDGRLNIVVDGGDRFRLLEVGHDRAYATGIVEEVVDEDDPPEQRDVERSLELFRRLQLTVGSEREAPDASSPQLDWQLIGRVDFATDRKQELLELTSPRRRFAQLGDLLDRALEALELESELRHRASTNGKVTPVSGE